MIVEMSEVQTKKSAWTPLFYCSDANGKSKRIYSGWAVGLVVSDMANTVSDVGEVFQSASESTKHTNKQHYVCFRNGCFYVDGSVLAMDSPAILFGFYGGPALIVENENESMINSANTVQNGQNNHDARIYHLSMNGIRGIRWKAGRNASNSIKRRWSLEDCVKDTCTNGRFELYVEYASTARSGQYVHFIVSPDSLWCQFRAYICIFCIMNLVNLIFIVPTASRNIKK